MKRAIVAWSSFMKMDRGDVDPIASPCSICLAACSKKLFSTLYVSMQYSLYLGDLCPIGTSILPAFGLTIKLWLRSHVGWRSTCGVG